MAVVFVLQWLFFHGKIGIVLLSQFLLTFLQTQTRGGAPLHSTAFYFSPADWEGIYDSLRYVLWEDIFQLVACTVASKMYWWVQVGIVINIRSSVHGFHLHGFWMLVLLLLLIEISCLIFAKQNKSSVSKTKFWRTPSPNKFVLKSLSPHKKLFWGKKSLPLLKGGDNLTYFFISKFLVEWNTYIF